MTDAPRSAGLVALADRIELWPIDRLRPYERNPRTHSEAQLDQIAASMVEFGWTNPVAWRDGLKPDPLLTVSEWADRYRVLSQRASSEPGRWRTERTPYLRDHGLPVAVFARAARRLDEGCSDRQDVVDLIAVYWAGDAIAHIMVSFGFAGDHVAISSETRKEKGEAYSSLAGFFKNYELIYAVGDERDLIRVRTTTDGRKSWSICTERERAPKRRAGCSWSTASGSTS